MTPSAIMWDMATLAIVLIILVAAAVGLIVGWNRLTARARKDAFITVLLHNPGIPLEQAGPVELRVFSVFVDNMAEWWGLTLWAWPGIQVVAVQLEVDGARPIPVEQQEPSLNHGVLRGSLLNSSGRWSTGPVGDLINEGSLVPDAAGKVRLRACVTLSPFDQKYTMWEDYKVVS